MLPPKLMSRYWHDATTYPFSMLGLRSHGLQELLTGLELWLTRIRGTTIINTIFSPYVHCHQTLQEAHRAEQFLSISFAAVSGRHFHVPCRMSGSIADSYPSDAPMLCTIVTNKITSRCCQMPLGRQDGLRTTDIEILSEPSHL